MSQTKDTDSFSDVPSGDEALLIDDTLDRKKLSLTYEKFVNDQKQQGIAKHASDASTLPRSPETVNNYGGITTIESTPLHKGKLDQIFEDVTAVFEKFENPFAVTPSDKPKQSKEKFFVDKTPSKQVSHNEVNLNFEDATLRTAADEFRALKEKGIHGFDPSITDTNTGLIIDTRKEIDNSVTENSLVDDDSSMKLNLIPHSSRPMYSNAFQQSAENIETTQKDGNIHEESNRIVCQSKFEDQENSKLYILDELNEDDNNELKDLDTTNTLNAIDVSITIDEDKSVVLSESEFKNEDDNTEIANAGTVNSTEESKNTQDTQHCSPYLIDTLKIAESTQNSSELKATQRIEGTQVELKATQIIDNTHFEILNGTQLIDPPDLVLKSTKATGCSSPSIIEEEGGIGVENHSIQDGVFILQQEMKQEKLVTAVKPDTMSLEENKGIEERAEEEDYDESILIGRLPTHRIVNESQSETQSQTLSQNQSQRPVDLSPVHPSVIHASPSNASQNEDEIQIEGTQNGEAFQDDHTKNIIYNSEKNDDKISHVSSPVILQESSSAPQADVTYMEVPNTSAPYVSGLDLDVPNKNDQEQSTPKASKGSILDKLNDVLNEDAEMESNETFITDNGPHHHENSDFILREHEPFEIGLIDVVGCRSLLYHHPIFERRMCGIIREISAAESSSKFRIESDPDDPMELWVSEKKFAAPICLNIGDSVKYLNRKKSNYVVTGLKRSLNNSNRVKTVNGFDKVLIKDKRDVSSEELEVFVYEIYFTKDIFKSYKYKIFNDESIFGQYIESIKTPGDVLKQLKLVEKANISTASVNVSETIKKSDLFNKCVFTVTLAHDSEVPGKDLIDFIEENGGLVLREGFGEILRFKKRDNVLNISPRKKKLILKNLEKMGNQVREPASKDFLDYACVIDQGDSYSCMLNDSEETSYMEDYIFGCVLATRHLRTVKYVEGLSLKWPILHLKFIERCMNDYNFFCNWKANWQKYLLIAGECRQLNCLTCVDVFEFRDNFNKGVTLRNQIKLNRIFTDSSITIIRDQYSKFTTPLSRNKNKRTKSGSFRKSQLVSDDESEESNSDDEEDEGSRERVGSLLWILRQVGFREAIVLKPRSKLPESGFIFVMRLEEKTAFERYYGNNYKNVVQIVDFDWLIQCLVTPQ
ncbi:hypothetical protein CANINC_003158 [Pichia inconspicua]|uniref:BRCT domain-containing protein n=1 Tax=Pichia inconspicua TaxID=52247 RepID=A0A4T0X0M4_9ASCO|nr:hypothetical protein CANINC_003158 [[Candida] inconspicua]